MDCRSVVGPGPWPPGHLRSEAQPRNQGRLAGSSTVGPASLTQCRSAEGLSGGSAAGAAAAVRRPRSPRLCSHGFSSRACAPGAPGAVTRTRSCAGPQAPSLAIRARAAGPRRRRSHVARWPAASSVVSVSPTLPSWSRHGVLVPSR